MCLLLATVVAALATAQQPRSVSVTPSDTILRVGASMQLTATVIDPAGNALRGRTVTWSAQNVATLWPSGLVTGVTDGGSATITATSVGKSGSAQVTVLKPTPLQPFIERGLEVIGLGCTILVSCPEYLRRALDEYRWRTRERIGFLSFSILALAGAWVLMRRRRRVRAA